MLAPDTIKVDIARRTDGSENPNNTKKNTDVIGFPYDRIHKSLKLPFFTP